VLPGLDQRRDEHDDDDDRRRGLVSGDGVHAAIVAHDAYGRIFRTS
jgi:hypothetical protein